MKLHAYHSLLWELLPLKGDKSSYLFGTIHLPERSLFKRESQVKELIRLSDVFMAEYALDEQSTDDQSVFQLPGNSGIDTYLSPKKYKKVRHQLLKSFQVDIARLNKLKPMILEQFLAENLVREHTGQPMDVLFWEFAKSEGKNMVGAETYERQLEIMREFPIDLQMDNLVKIARNPSKYRQQVAKLMDYYEVEDIVSLYKNSMKSLANMKQIMVYERNVAITASIVKYMQSGKVFCAVGAGHLYGHRGILRLLKKQGIKTIPRYFSPEH